MNLANQSPDRNSIHKDNQESLKNILDKIKTTERNEDLNKNRKRDNKDMQIVGDEDGASSDGEEKEKQEGEIIKSGTG